MGFQFYVAVLFLFSLSSAQPSVRQSYGEFHSCRFTAGVCINTSKYSCSRPTLSGRCPGAANIRCCPSYAGFRFSTCAIYSGYCKRTSDCSTTTLTGKCPGPSGIRCCIPRGTTPSKTPTPTPVPAEWSSCTNYRGVCIDTNRYSCQSPTVSNKCRGGSNIRCCPAASGVRYGSCATRYRGLCKLSTDCTTGTVVGACPGPSTIRCCQNILTPSPKPRTPIPSSEAGEWSDCKKSAGVCIHRKKYKCSKSLKKGECAGSKKIRCCRSPGGVKDDKCRSLHNGLCQRSEDCQSSKVQEICPGPGNVVCCKNAALPTPSKSPSPSPNRDGEWSRCKSSKGLCFNKKDYKCSGKKTKKFCKGSSQLRCCKKPGGIISSGCNRIGGLCMYKNDCPRSTVSNLCPGPTSVMCCPPKPTPGVTVEPGVDVPVAPGIFLEDNPPKQTQFRSRRASNKPVIVVHTAEAGSKAGPPDKRAENVAEFVRTRGNYGSYHLIGDTDSIIQLVKFENAAYHDGTGSNDWSIGISLGMNAADWPSLDSATRNQLVRVAAQMAAKAANWMVSTKGLQAPVPVLLTKAQSDTANASGFISHARRDPARRSDPGADFPWEQFFEEYKKRI